MHPVNGHALRLVDGGGIAMIDSGIVLEIEGHRRTVVEHHRHAGRGDAFNPPQRAVLDAKAALVASEHHPVAGRKVPLALLD